MTLQEASALRISLRIESLTLMQDEDPKAKDVAILMKSDPNNEALRAFGIESAGLWSFNTFGESSLSSADW